MGTCGPRYSHVRACDDVQWDIHQLSSNFLHQWAAIPWCQWLDTSWTTWILRSHKMGWDAVCAPSFIPLKSMPSRWLLGKFLPYLLAEGLNVGHSSALPLLYHLLNEQSGHYLPMFGVPRLYGYVLRPLQGGSHVLD